VISAPPNFVTANASLSKRGIIIINIAGYWRVFTNYDDGQAALGGSGFGGGAGHGSIGPPNNTGVITVPGNAGPWNYNDPYYSFHLTGTIGPPAQIPVVAGQYVKLTYQSGVVLYNPGAVPYGPYGVGYGSTSTGIYPWPSDRCANGGYPNGSNISLLAAFTDASGNVVGGVGPFEMAYSSQGFVMGPAPAGTTHLNLGVNSYEDWSHLSGAWNVGYQIANSGVGGDMTGSGAVLGGANCDWLETFADLHVTISELDGTAKIDAFAFTALDYGGLITSDFPTFVFEGKQVTVQTGFPGMALSDFALLFTGVIDTVQSANDNQSYTFNCTDNLQVLTKVIYTKGDDGQPISKNNMKTLNAHPLDILTDILLNQVGLAPATVNQAKILGYRNGIFVAEQFQFTLDASQQADKFIETQIMKPLGGYLWTNSKGQIDVNFFYKDTRPAAFFGCLIAAWTDGTGQLVAEPFAPGLDATMSAPTGATQLQLGVNNNSWGSGSGSWTIAVNGTSYTIGPNNAPWLFTGGINSAYPFTSSGASGPVVLAVTAGNSYRIQYLTGLLATHVTLTGTGNYRDATGVEPQTVPQQANCPDAWVLQPWLRGRSSQLSLTDDLMAQIPLAGQVTLINEVTYRFDQDPGSSGNYNTEAVSIYNTSVSRYNQYGAQVIESAGMRAGLQGVYLAAQISNLLFLRYGMKNLTFAEVDLLWSTCILEPGDIVDVTSVHVPNRLTGVMGVSGMLMEVFDRTWDFNAGIVKLRLIDASYLATVGTALIAPAGTPDWTLASTAQKTKYMFLCNDSDQYSDGSAGALLG
jgi:hypothetical protein